jgi:sialic acid synthase SpsE
VDNLSSKENSDFADLQSQINLLTAALGLEQSNRTTSEAELLAKIDMLFLYFFHHNSKGAYIDSDNQIQFMY